MDIEELKGVMVDINTVMKIVISRHGICWAAWYDDEYHPKPDALGQYDLHEVYVWLGY
ncbi:hypothetical protein [Kosakonia phage Kc166A]|uniref:Uncharacterized protein n=1 Tax=Kosakonia phage Kc166A TaxID=2801381 RepID=A0AAE7UWP6_9CAUD|nr:hypothetical protein [Kosakonia phage Kc166A]